jgi:hypothetical protein
MLINCVHPGHEASHPILLYIFSLIDHWNFSMLKYLPYMRYFMKPPFLV